MSEWAEHTDAERYQWLKARVTERLTDGSLKRPGVHEHKTQYVLPLLISWADFCGPITFDEAVDIAMSREQNSTKA